MKTLLIKELLVSITKNQWNHHWANIEWQILTHIEGELQAIGAQISLKNCINIHKMGQNPKQCNQSNKIQNFQETQSTISLHSTGHRLLGGVLGQTAALLKTLAFACTSRHQYTRCKNSVSQKKCKKNRNKNLWKEWVFSHTWLQKEGSILNLIRKWATRKECSAKPSYAKTNSQEKDKNLTDN